MVGEKYRWVGIVYPGSHSFLGKPGHLGFVCGFELESLIVEQRAPDRPRH